MADPDHGSIPPTDKFRIVSICYLTGRKGVDILIDSIKEINADLELLVAGKGPQSPELHRLAKDDDRIKFLGYVSEGKKTALLESADLFVLPSRHEPWGLVVNEALNCGTPVITTSTAGAEMILNNRHVVPPADVDALCQAISAEMKTPSSPPTPPSVEDMACILK
nr:hypothetical protein DEQ67_07080 [Haloferax sp. Atlit-48N]